MVGFIDLSAELRNAIYSIAARDDSSLVIKLSPEKINYKQCFIGETGLIAANKEISTEYQPYLLAYPFDSDITIVATVTDFDFRDLVKFLKQYVTSNPARMQHFTDASNPRIVIQLQLDNLHVEDAKALGQWFLVRKSLDISVAYEVAGVRGDKLEWHVEKINIIFWSFSSTDLGPECVSMSKPFTTWRDEKHRLACGDLHLAADNAIEYDFDEGLEQRLLGIAQEEQDKYFSLADFEAMQQELDDGGFNYMGKFDGVGYEDDDLAGEEAM